MAVGSGQRPRASYSTLTSGSNHVARDRVVPCGRVPFCNNEANCAMYFAGLSGRRHVRIIRAHENAEIKGNSPKGVCGYAVVTGPDSVRYEALGRRPGAHSKRARSRDHALPWITFTGAPLLAQCCYFIVPATSSRYIVPFHQAHEFQRQRMNHDSYGGSETCWDEQSEVGVIPMDRLECCGAVIESVNNP
jgi:hypothetical protein